MSDADFIAHYGVKGMKWGVRKNRGVEKSRDILARRRGVGRDKISDDDARQVQKISTDFYKERIERANTLGRYVPRLHIHEATPEIVAAAMERGDQRYSERRRNVLIANGAILVGSVMAGMAFQGRRRLR